MNEAEGIDFNLDSSLIFVYLEEFLYKNYLKIIFIELIHQASTNFFSKDSLEE
jgi:hypothetical protein